MQRRYYSPKFAILHPISGPVSDRRGWLLQIGKEVDIYPKPQADGKYRQYRARLNEVPAGTEKWYLYPTGRNGQSADKKRVDKQMRRKTAVKVSSELRAPVDAFGVDCVVPEDIRNPGTADGINQPSSPDNDQNRQITNKRPRTIHLEWRRRRISVWGGFGRRPRQGICAPERSKRDCVGIDGRLVGF